MVCHSHCNAWLSLGPGVGVFTNRGSVSLSVQGSMRGVRVVGLGYWYWEDEIVIPSDVIEVGEEFTHV